MKRAVLDPVSNGAAESIKLEQPYVASIVVEGTASILFHRWNNESVEAKSKATKNSAAKKTDDIESYVWRDQDGTLCIPGEYLRRSIIEAARFRQDPRSPRKSAMDLFKAGVVVLTELASLGVKDWDYLDKRRVTIQRNGITRCRPAMLKGWRAQFEVQVLTPEYIDAHLLNEVTVQAGRLIGLGDFRPTFGRFQVVKFDLIEG